MNRLAAITADADVLDVALIGQSRSAERHQRMAGDHRDVLLAVDLYVIGAMTIWPPRLAFQSSSPVRASSAWK